MGRGNRTRRDTALTASITDATRRRRLTAAGAAAATMAIAGTFGVLSLGADDAPPALSTPTSSVTPEPTPTSPSSPPSSEPSPSSEPTPSSEPSASSGPSRTSSPTPSLTPTSGSSSSDGDVWSGPVTVAGSTYRARFVARPGERNHDVVLQRDGTTVFAPDSVFNTEGRWGVDESDRRLVYYLGGVRVTDLLAIGGRPVEDEVVGHVALPTPDGVDVAGEPYLDLHITIVRTTSTNPEGITGWVVQVEDGGVWALSAD